MDAQTPMSATVAVDIALNDGTVPVGTVWVEEQRGQERSQFAYDPAWRERSDAFAIEPNLPLVAGRQVAEGTRALPGAISDTAPDRWGREVIAAAHAGRGQQRPPGELDYLLAVSDATRVGALRFRTAPDGAYEAPASPRTIPRRDELDSWLALVAAAGIARQVSGGFEPGIRLVDGSSLWRGRDRQGRWVYRIGEALLPPAASAGARVWWLLAYLAYGFHDYRARETPARARGTA